MRAGVSVFLVLAVAILNVGCVHSRDPEIQAFLRFQKESGGDLAGAYENLSDKKKMEIFFGAMKIHPPSGSIGTAVSKQSVSFLYALRDEIERREGFVEAYALNNAVIEKRRRGEMTMGEVESLKLRELCSVTRADQNVCAAQMELMR